MPPKQRPKLPSPQKPVQTGPLQSPAGAPASPFKNFVLLKFPDWKKTTDSTSPISTPMPSRAMEAFEFMRGVQTGEVLRSWSHVFSAMHHAGERNRIPSQDYPRVYHRNTYFFTSTVLARGGFYCWVVFNVRAGTEMLQMARDF